MSLADKPVNARTAADPAWGNGTESFEGITLLEHYAGLAMQSYMNAEESGTVESAAKELGIATTEYDYRTHWPVLVARRSLDYARALIAELEKEQQS